MRGVSARIYSSILKALGSHHYILAIFLSCWSGLNAALVEAALAEVADNLTSYNDFDIMGLIALRVCLSKRYLEEKGNANLMDLW